MAVKQYNYKDFKRKIIVNTRITKILEICTGYVGVGIRKTYVLASCLASFRNKRT